MTAHRLLRRAALLALVLAVIALSLGAVRAAVALDRRLAETRYVVERRGCPLVEWSPGVIWEACPIGQGQGET